MPEDQTAPKSKASPYTRWRVLVRTGFLLLLLATPLRVLGFDHHTGKFFFLHWAIPLEKLYLPFIVSLLLFVVIVLVSMRYGRIFCSWLCPMHTYLEWTQHKKGLRVLLAIFLATLAMEVVLSLFLSVPDQISILRTSTRWPMLAGTMAAIWLGFLILLLYRERFCQQACPYALVQLLLQSENTRIMQFQDPDRRCIHCNKCDTACPQKLKARMECSQRHCTNCYRCAEACHDVLGQDKGLFELEERGCVKCSQPI